MPAKILVANRGEIALRVIQACQEMRIASVAVYSDADQDALHTRFADQAVRIGPALSRKSYLNIERILAAAKKNDVDAIHPGYGFLSENASFAKACETEGIIFIGPSAGCLARAGDKARVRQIVSDTGVPIIPGTTMAVADVASACEAAKRIGYPVIIKASGGGGGRGMRIAHDKQGLIEAFQVAGGEARVAFGSPDLYMEKYIERPRHIEIQILADHHGNCIHLGERECSIQKRYQKLIEEAPSPFVDEDLRQAMGQAAIKVAKSVDYQNAGTIEFLVDAQKNFYFMEVNARIQVEHPITEWVTGVDLIREQIRIADGHSLPYKQKDIQMRGWSMECRINAADPENDFMPSPGEVTRLLLPHGPGVRIDTMLYSGCMVPPFYDSLICKLSVCDGDRPAAIRRMDRALAAFEIEGIEVTVPFHRRVLADADFRRGKYDTHFLERFEKTESGGT